ncbi:MAG: 3-phosphoserine/phosphohydroxythreonine transaminase [Legionellales bacterium]
MNHNASFSAGPAALPHSVLCRIQKELFDWDNTGVSILEIGHRTPQFAELGAKLESSVRRILQVPNDFAVLFMPGGGQVQFSMAAMNLAGGFKHANYVETGHWSTFALNEARKYFDIHIAASSKDQKFTSIPDLNTWDIKPGGAYLHFTDNETIGGLEYQSIPDLDEVVLVSDMSSNIFSRPIDFTRLGCIYACAQKNFGVAGMSLVIVRRDLLDRALPQTPAVLNYATQEKNKSLACTPTTFSWYVASLILDWIEEEGGLRSISQINLEKSRLLYEFIDSSELYSNSIDPHFRSRMNVPFVIKNKQLEADFFKAAKAQGLLYLEGHRSVGGARASIYNAISLDEVGKLVDFMRDFAG